MISITLAATNQLLAFSETYTIGSLQLETTWICHAKV